MRSAAARSGRRAAGDIRAVILAAVAALAAVVLGHAIGPAGFLVPIGLLAIGAALASPRIALALLAGCAILFEAETPNALHFTTQQIHDPIPGHYSFLEILMVLGILSVLRDAARRRRWPLRPVPFGPILGVLVIGLLSGLIVGHYSGQGFNAITEELRPFLPMLIVPWLAVNAIRDRKDLRLAIAALALMAAVKSALGLIGVVTHVGAAVNGTTITYYEATANWLAMTFVLTIVAATAGRVPIGRLARWAFPLVLLALVLSLRRSFWIGTVAAIPFALAIAASPWRRRLLVPTALILGAAIWIAASTGIGIDSQSSVGQRIQSLNPSSLTTNAEDRYRLDERTNVLAAIRTSPLVGLGFAVSWPIRYPLSVANSTGQGYVHMAVLFYWLKMGILGLIAYVGYLLIAVVVSIQVFRRHPDPWVRAAGAGASAGLVGLAVAETTATFLGSDLRTTVLIGFVVGLLAVAYREIRDSASPTATVTMTPVDRIRARRFELAHLAHGRAQNGAVRDNMD